MRTITQLMFESIIQFAILISYSDRALPPRVDHLWCQSERSLNLAKASWKRNRKLALLQESNNLEFLHANNAARFVTKNLEHLL